MEAFTQSTAFQQLFAAAAAAARTNRFLLDQGCSSASLIPNGCYISINLQH